jgi:hypothetical protein
LLNTTHPLKCCDAAVKPQRGALFKAPADHTSIFVLWFSSAADWLVTARVAQIRAPKIKK